jgi:hypothetical protein
MVSRLIDESLTQLHPEVLDFLRKKLCRRLVKLEVDKDRASPSSQAIYEYYFTKLSPLFSNSVKAATDQINLIWTAFKRSNQRPVLPLPRYARQDHMDLALPNSHHYIQNILSQPLQSNDAAGSFNPHKLPEDYHMSAAATDKKRAIAFLCFSLSGLEIDIHDRLVSYSQAIPTSQSSCAQRCENIAESIEDYMATVADAYSCNSEQKSIMLLTIMELWMAMDECAMKIYEPLKLFSPGFPADILNVLQLARFTDVMRLQKVSKYLQDRHSASKLKITFFHSGKGCFAEAYFNQSEELQQLKQRIEAAAELARSKKEQEWRELKLEHENLISTIAQATCVFYENDMQVKIHDDRHCKKCYLERKASRFRIKAHEHPLPSDPVQAKEVVFELACPKAFAAYRDITWSIIASLGSPALTEGAIPQLLLGDYSELRQYMVPMPRRFSLASTTKSFLMTHYANLKFPCPSEDVFLPNGLKVGYYDTERKVWPARQLEKPTFAHHCNLVIPSNSPFSVFNHREKFNGTSNGPTSYEVLASQSECPSGLNVHEYMAFQTLISGKNCRWIQMLIELGSSNMNFSTETTAFLISTLALQVGPSYESDALGTVHRIFRDKSFCNRLLEQVDQRLDGISSNVRKSFLRIHSYGSRVLHFLPISTKYKYYYICSKGHYSENC